MALTNVVRRDRRQALSTKLHSVCGNQAPPEGHSGLAEPHTIIRKPSRLSAALRRLYQILTVTVAASISVAAAQSITVTPNSNVTDVVGKQVQFSAKVTGITNTKVNWYAGGVKGGSTAAGKITPAGLYTAPATLPDTNPVTIKAVSQASSSLSASVSVKIVPTVAKLSSVTPNPLSVGSIKVTLVGSGFQPGVGVYDTSNGNASLFAISSLTSTKIVATGTQVTADSASFTVVNVGVAASNAIVVPIKKYTLTVKNGTGSGSYAPGKVVSIKSNAPPAGKVFKNWTGATVANPNSESTTLTMPAANATVTANYQTSGTKYQLTVNSGAGSGSYAAGAVVTITANAPPQGQTFSNWTGAIVANPTASTTTLTMPAAATSVTANYTNSTSQYQLTVNNGSGSGSYAAGTVVTITANTPPQGETFANWTGATVVNPNSATTTLTMPAAITTVTANYSSGGTIPFPVTTHPRIWITQADLPKLQSWAVSSNPVYQQGMAPLLAQAVNIYETQFFPGGQPNPNYPDLGDTQGYQGQLTEEVGVILAFNSLIDPAAANRIKYAKYARNLIMYALSQTAQGFQANAPFRDPTFILYNRGDLCGHQWPLIVDWIYSAKDASNNPILTAADKATIRTAFMLWAGTCLTASTTGGDHPEPIGVTNDLSLINNGTAPYRMASNNYYLGHARNLTMLALSLDPSDDPAVDPSKSVAVLGNSLRSYILDANGAWLYQTYAMMGEPSQVAQDYGISGNGAGFGLASGGLPPEGMMYGESFGTLLGQLLALHTAGFDDTSITGPQAKLSSAPVWDRYVTAYLSSLTPVAAVNPAASYLGPLYYFACFGDVLETYVTPDCMQPVALLGILQQKQGKTTNLNACKWFATNAVQGTLQYNTSTPWTWGCMQSILYYMLLDPSASAATDPRPSFPTYSFDSLTGRVMSRTDWSANPNWFTYRASWESINHQHGDAGSFGLYRNGEWLTSEMTNYDNNEVGFTPYYLNSLCLKNWCSNGTPSLGWYEAGMWNLGGQWILDSNAGDPTTISSNGSGYTFASTDMTNLYNRPNQWTAGDNATDITQATRSILWINPDVTVVYDRATSVHAGLFKTFNMCLTTSPTITGNSVQDVTPGGQNLFVQTLLPQNPTITSKLASGDLNPVAEFETMNYVLTVTDASNPTDTRFLHVLQGANGSAKMVPATYVKSTTGTAFDGAVFGTTAVFFTNKANPTLSATTLVVPSSVTTLYIAGLAANTSFSVTTQTGSNGKTITLNPAGTGNVSDAAGLLKVGI